MNLSSFRPRSPVHVPGRGVKSGVAYGLRISLAFLLFSLSANSLAAGEKPKWTHDLDGAKKRAGEAAKELLIVFTGHGWCYHCDLLDREVFQQAAFRKAADRDFIPVELDFTFSDSAGDKDRAARYRKLQAQYLVRSFPTVVLTDSAGVPYAIQTGYAKGTGATASLAMIRLAQFARIRRDECFQRAAGAVGAERAEHLHRGIQAVAGLLGSLDDRGDDPVLAFYRAQVEDILKEGTPAVRAHYEVRRARRDEWLRREAVFAKLRDFDAAKDYRGALRYLAEQLKTADDRPLRWRLELARQTYLEWDEQHGEALKNARRLADRPDLSPGDREVLLDREAYNLDRLGRVGELALLYDRRIAAAKDAPQKRLDLLREKAQWLGHNDRPAETTAAWRVYREAAKPGGEDWLTATAGLADALRKAGQHRPALKLLSEYLATDKAAWIMLEAAECHLALGESDRARALVEEAEAASADLRKSTNQLDARILARIDDRIKNLRRRSGITEQK